MRDVAPPPKESQKAEGWMKTVHAKLWAEGKADAPFCPQCHTAHAVRRASDPDSAVNRANLDETCGACHADEARSFDVGGALARWRLSGHGKGDLANRYADDECLSCHQGEAAHGEETVTGQRCPECHRPAAKIEAKTGGFHIRVGEKATLTGKIARIGYNLLFWGAIAVVLLLALLWGFTARFGSGDGDDA